MSNQQAPMPDILKGVLLLAPNGQDRGHSFLALEGEVPGEGESALE